MARIGTSAAHIVLAIFAVAMFVVSGTMAQDIAPSPAMATGAGSALPVSAVFLCSSIRGAELGSNMYTLSFANLEVMEVILENGPWMVMGFCLNLKRWVVDRMIQELDFTKGDEGQVRRYDGWMKSVRGKDNIVLGINEERDIGLGKDCGEWKGNRGEGSERNVQ
ncbi:hypothetical protein J1N35_017753 [Gossypium stocksii]|uniref:DUF4283 domain-containing protein n=1 Tax=Gossypium stocksii TaxID=47602 RepID=A0A9D3VMP5_9ROSI|nr:hypothetical protein J1N35_017753 [Gossypium stocksii]